MSMKVLPNSKKHQCPRQRCQGDQKDYRNYLVPNSHSKKNLRRPQTTRSQHSINQHLPKQSKIQPKLKPSKSSLLEKSEMSELKRRNEENILKNSQLSEQLQLKSRRITELKQKIKDYELKLKGSEERIVHLQAIINESQHPKSPITSSHSQQYILTSYQQQMRTFESNQKLMLDQIQKCRMVERQYHQYRGETERKIQRLTLENEQLRHIQSADKDYDGQIDQLRKQLLKLSQQKHSPDLTSCTSEHQITALKSSNRQLLAEREHLLLKIEEQTIKEGDLRRNLETINRRVQKWGQEYAEIIEEKKRIEEKCQHLQRKLQQKKDRHQKQKEQWARIFKQLTHLVEKSKRDIQRLQRSNQKLINIYSEPNQ